MTTRHDTPLHIARILARFAPNPCRSVLDPSVGSGVLVRQFLLNDHCKRIECIDIDKNAIAKLESLDRSGKVKVHADDFVRWASPNGDGNRKRFKCVMMNPPFAGTQDRLVPITVPGSDMPLHVPIEAAFVHLSMNLLRIGGRLIAIVPASIISGTSTRWLRGLLMDRGNVKVVHELPNWTFPGIDGKIYILVYEHGQPQSLLAIRNHRLVSPDVIRVSRPKAQLLDRWDFGYVQARRWHDVLVKQGEFAWTSLSDVCDVRRGQVESPITDGTVLHTTNFFRDNFGSRGVTEALRDVKPGDIIMKRVGRRSALSPVLFSGRVPVRASDCVLRMRPRGMSSSAEILFALRALIGWPVGAALVERGVGAKYVTVNDLESLRIPLGLGKAYPQLFAKYKTLLLEKRWDHLSAIEEQIRRRFAT